MIFRNKLFYLILAFSTCIAGCSTTKSPNTANTSKNDSNTSLLTSGQDESQKPMENQPKNTSEVQNNFGFNLFNLVNKNDADNANKLISPISVYLDLSMLYNGANAQTKTAMEQALQLNGLKISVLNQTNASLLKNLPAIDSSVTIDIANAIWYRNSLSLLDAFSQTNQDFYKAKVQGSPFNSTTVAEINAWVSEKTHQKINSIIDNIKPDDLMFLLNAVYFKGKWTEPFDKKSTKEKPFKTPNGEIDVPFMYAKERLSYVENDSIQIAEIPYDRGNFGMYVLLPKDEKGFKAFVNSLNAASFSSLISAMNTREIKLFLPKWESSYSANLNNELSEMGMADAFSNAADFSKIFKNSTAKISDVNHKTYIKVDEEGTEAAAVTSIGMTTTSVRLNPPTIPVMNVNHPFVYVITEKSSGSILFLGVLYNPKEK